MPRLTPLLLAAPWILGPVVTLVRARYNRSLDEEPAEPPNDSPLVSVVIPARNEAHNIRRCVESALASLHNYVWDRPPRVLICGSLYLAGEVLAANGTLPE